MITTLKHPNSHVITIFRKGSFVIDAQKEGAADFIAQARKSIGSYWENSFSKAQGSGLTFAEQKLLMPTIVDCEPEDKTFRKAVSDYFACVRTTVPYDTGRELEIGLEADNSKAVSADNMPLNLSDFITYRHALKHPLVAADRRNGEGNILKEFYIFDPTEDEKTNIEEDENRDKALELYLKISKQADKMNMLLTLLGIDPRSITGHNIKALKAARLKKVAETKPDKFVATFSQKLFEEQYVIQTMINVGILNKVGERIIDPENGDTLGHNMVEASAYIKDKKNNDRLVILKARMQEALAEPEEATEKAK